MKRLLYGERKEVKASRQHSMWKHNNFKVEAECYDSETPMIHLLLGADSICMTDIETMDLIDRLQRALGALPSSK